jgi:hypothetical protein
MNISYNNSKNISYKFDEENPPLSYFDIENQNNFFNNDINIIDNYLTNNNVNNNNYYIFKDKIKNIIFEKINNLIKKINN